MSRQGGEEVVEDRAAGLEDPLRPSWWTRTPRYHDIDVTLGESAERDVDTCRQFLLRVFVDVEGRKADIGVLLNSKRRASSQELHRDGDCGPLIVAGLAGDVERKWVDPLWNSYLLDDGIRAGGLNRDQQIRPL